MCMYWGGPEYVCVYTGACLRCLCVGALIGGQRVWLCKLQAGKGDWVCAILQGPKNIRKEPGEAKSGVFVEEFVVLRVAAETKIESITKTNAH